MKRVASLFILAACLAMSCMKHEADFAETGAFKVLSVKLTDVALADGSPLTLSGKLLIPRDGAIKNMVSALPR